MNTYDEEAGHILTAALKKILKGGWCQHLYDNDQGAHCLIGALYAVSTGAYALYDAKEILRKVTNCEDLFLWNDAPGRTQQEVVEVLRMAIGKVS